MTQRSMPARQARVPELLTPQGMLARTHYASVYANWRAFHVGVPEGFAPYVYRYRDLVGNLIYVGMTSDATRRADEHLKDSDWTSWVASVEYHRCRSRNQAFRLETKIRNDERPLFVGRTGYAALMAELDAKYQTNHVTGVCASVGDSRRQDPSAWPEHFLLGLFKALPDEQESQNVSDRFHDACAMLSEQPRWLGGRPGYGAIAVPMAGGGFTLAADTDRTALIAAEAARRVIVGETPLAVIADLNVRSIPATDGGLWKAETLRDILRNPLLADVGIISQDEFRQLQAALDARAQKHNPVAEGRNYLDLVYCGKCGAKVYKWHRKRYSQFFGRCRNELKRYETDCFCRLPMAPYDVIDQAITREIEHKHGTCLIETRLTNTLRDQRAGEISAELSELAGKFTAKAISRETYLAQQASLIDEAEALQVDCATGTWTSTGETVSERWARLSDYELPLWMKRLGVTYTLECVRPPVRRPGGGRHGWDAGEWTLILSWPASDDPTVLDRIRSPSARTNGSLGTPIAVNISSGVVAFRAIGARNVRRGLLAPAAAGEAEPR